MNKYSVSDKINSFSLDLYRTLRSESGNLFFSPYSIYTALSMAYAGASGETAGQMAETLGLSLEAEKEHQEIGRLMDQLYASKESYELTVANALWGQKGYKFIKSFLTILKDQYQSELNQVDFKRYTEKARKTINQWVEKKTNNKIKELLVPGSLNDQMLLVLTNAIYFKSAWHKRFEEGATRDEPFHLSRKEKILVPMMRQTEDFKYYENKKIQMLQLAYINYDLAMLIILPREIEGLAEVEKNLHSEDLKSWIEEMKIKEVIVSFPKFKTTSTFILKDTLTAMGIKDAFSIDDADFSGMTGKRDFFISDVIHKAYVDVDEEGTEAAAATAMYMAKAEPFFKKPKPKVFKADHPFLFLIRDNDTGTILFIGRVVNPSK